MSLTIARGEWQIERDHVHLLIQSPDVIADANCRERGPDAVALAGMLARAALDLDYPLRVQQREHRCVNDVRRYDDDVDELVEGQQYAGCGLALIGGDADDAHLIQYGRLPHLALTVPINRERAWRARIATALERVAQQNAATTLPPPTAVT